MLYVHSRSAGASALLRPVLTQGFRLMKALPSGALLAALEGDRRANHTLALTGFHPKEAHVSSIHISLANASYDHTQLKEVRENAILSYA